MLDLMGPEQPKFGLRIKKGVHVAIKDGGSNHTQGGDKDDPEHLTFGKVGRTVVMVWIRFMHKCGHRTHAGAYSGPPAVKYEGTETFED